MPIDANISRLPTAVTASVKKLNPHLYGATVYGTTADGATVAILNDIAPGKRIRQDSKPTMNKLERSFYDYHRALNPDWPRMIPQGMRVKIAGSAWYKVDFFTPGKMVADEVKGPRVMKNQQSRQMLALKVAANQWPEIIWRLNWKENGEWKQQIVRP